MKRPGDFHVTLLDFDLRWLVAYQTPLVQLLATNAERVRSVLLPFQSGSDRILALMRRHHTAREAKEALIALRAACPDMVLDTHVLLGFPGETRADFEDTLAFLRLVRFDHVTVYEYEDRPGTIASQMSPKVPRRTIKARGLRVRRETAGLGTALICYFQDWGLRSGARAQPTRDDSQVGGVTK